MVYKAFLCELIHQIDADIFHIFRGYEIPFNREVEHRVLSWI